MEGTFRNCDQNGFPFLNILFGYLVTAHPKQVIQSACAKDSQRPQAFLYFNGLKTDEENFQAGSVVRHE